MARASTATRNKPAATPAAPPRAPASPTLTSVPQPKPSKTVIVASKLPMSLQLQICEMRPVTRRLRETVWTENEAVKVGPMVLIRGTSHPRGQPPEGFREPPVISGGYALTEGIDRDWWEMWEEQNKDSPMVANGLVYACKDRPDVASRAKTELRGVVSGLDPITPPKEGQSSDDPRLPKSIKGITIGGEAGPTDADAA